MNFVFFTLDPFGAACCVQNGDIQTGFFFDKEYKITTGFFSENTIVVAEGEMLLEGIFQVGAIFRFLEICLNKSDLLTTADSFSSFYVL